MPLPTINDVQAVEPILTNLVVGYQQSDDRYVAGKVFPAIGVDKDSGTYYIFTKKYWMMNDMQPRAYGTEYSMGGFGVSTGTYATIQYALAFPLSDEVRRNNQVPLDMETAAARWLANNSMLNKEIKFSADFMKTSVWGTDNTTDTDWDDFTSGDPISSVLTAKQTISKNTGYDPNTMVIGYVVKAALVNHPDILDRVKYVNAVNADYIDGALAAVFGLANVWTSKASYTTANEAVASPTYSTIIDDDALICYVEPSPGLFQASSGYTFAWPGGGGTGTATRIREDSKDADVVRLKEQWDQVVVASDLGYFFSDIV